MEIRDPGTGIQISKPVSSLVNRWRPGEEPHSISMITMSHRDNISLLIDSGGNHWVIGIVVTCMFITLELRYLWKWHCQPQFDID